MAKNEVTLSIENYNKLLLENAKLKEAITIEISSWDNQRVELKVDLATIFPIIKQKFEDEGLTEKYELRDKRNLYEATTNIASMKEEFIEEEKEEE